MAGLAIPAAVHGGDRASPLTVFIVTTLDTHLAMTFSSSDTVADLKKKIIEEHPLCFPEHGAIKIDGLKVKMGGLYYHLAESMLVKTVFDERIEKSFFLSAEASVIVCKDKEIQGIQNHGDEANLNVVNVKKNGFDDEGAGLVQNGDWLEMRNEPSSLHNQNGSSGADGLAVEVAEMAQLSGGVRGDNVKSIVETDSRREEESDGRGQDVEVQAIETQIDGCVLQGGDLNDLSKSDGQAQDLEVQVMGNRMDGSVLQGEDLNDNSNMKEKLKKRKRSENGDDDDDDLLINELMILVLALAARGTSKVLENASAEVQVEDGEPAKEESNKDDLVSEPTDKPSMGTSEHESVAKKERLNEGRTIVTEYTEMTFQPSSVSELPADVDRKIKRKKKPSKKPEEEINDVDEILQKQARSGNGNVVSELNDTTSEPLTVSQLPIGDDQQLVNANVEGSNTEVKKKRKNKSYTKKDKQVNVLGTSSLLADTSSVNTRTGKKKTSEVSGAWNTSKGEKKRKVEDVGLDNVTPKLPEAPNLTGKRGSEATPHAAQFSKPKEIVEHYSESSTNSTSKPKRSNNVKGSNAHRREVLNTSDNTSVFPPQQKSPSTIPDSYVDVSSYPDGESDAGISMGAILKSLDEQNQQGQV